MAIRGREMRRGVGTGVRCLAGALACSGLGVLVPLLDHSALLAHEVAAWHGRHVEAGRVIDEVAEVAAEQVADGVADLARVVGRAVVSVEGDLEALRRDEDRIGR